MNNSSIYSTMVRAGKTTYFVDIREAKNGSNYLSISEHRMDAEGKRDRSVIRVFGESCTAFTQAVAEAVASMK